MGGDRGALDLILQPDSESAWAQHARVVEALETKHPTAAQLLGEAAEDVLAFTHFPKEHWHRIRSNNPQERLNREIRRRTDVVGIFPNRQAVIRLVGAVLAELHDEWQVSRRYMSLESLEKVGLKTNPDAGGLWCPGGRNRGPCDAKRSATWTS